jgi:hypothetical protein
MLTIVGVDGVTSDKEVTCIHSAVTFTVTTDPPGNEDLVNWSGGGSPATQAGGATFTTSWSATGSYTVTATCGTSSKTKTVKVVKPTGISADSVSDTNPGVEAPLQTLTVVCGTGSVSIAATASPSVSASDLPSSWAISKVSGSLGLGSTPGKLSASVSKATPGDITVQVTCCGSCTEHYRVRVVVVSVAIKAADGANDPPNGLCVNTSMQYKAVVTPPVGGTYSWTTTSGKVTLANASSDTVTVNAGSAASGSPDAETIKVEFTPTGSSAHCDATRSLTVAKIEVTSFQTAAYLPGTDNPSDPESMGDDVTITYVISPTGYTVDAAVLGVKDKDGTVVYTCNTIDKTGGSHNHVWSVSTTSLRSVNSDMDPYRADATITVNATNGYHSLGGMAVQQSTASVVAETSVKTSAPLAECMEGRYVTFTATARGFVSEDIAWPHKINFTFHFQHADGTPWTATDWSFDLVEDHIAVADNVPDADTDHSFETPIYVTVADDYGHAATSAQITIKVYELWIEHFKDNATGKNWKVVANQPIAYKAIASPDCTNWAWDMQDGRPKQWNPTGGNAIQGTMAIPNSDLPSDSGWDHLGDDYGTVDVFCEDEEGNNHHFYSTSMSPSTQARVFFLKNETTHPAGTTPNWYYYWRMFLPWGQIQTLAYDAGLAAYGETDPASRATTIGPVAGAFNGVTGHRGIHTAYETLAHESHHIVLWNGWWGVGGTPVPAQDTDGDQYPDNWETTDPGAIAAGFAVPQDDRYSLGSGHAGYDYEEQECEQVERALDEDAFDSKDWSMDPLNVNQGKQWP